MRKSSLFVTLATAAAIAVPVTAPSAFADVTPQGPTRRCNNYQACFYFNSNQAGAVGPIVNGAANLDGQVFKPGTGTGAGRPVENHAASWDSRTRNTSFCVHRDRWWKGPYNSLKPQGRKNLSSAVKNKNSSTNWYPRHGDGSGH
ncbi:hypothetical protein ACFWZ2_15915 [Streptomyces sp. NPDC059002]|uniref:hypothetical protein n=1 Tax=Streptomyces sp. NPDC059002 TaxID=3346690 RepID=UPI003692383F